MPRWCSACGRPLDEEGHDVEYAPEKPPAIAGWYHGQRVRVDAEPQHGRRRYRCRVRLIATSMLTGKRLSPRSPQRIIETDTKFVHERNL